MFYKFFLTSLIFCNLINCLQENIINNSDYLSTVNYNVDNNLIIKRLNKAKDLLSKDVILTKLIHTLISLIKNDNCKKALKTLNYFLSLVKTKCDQKQLGILNEIQLLLQPNTDYTKFRYLEPNFISELATIDNKNSFISMSWSKCSNKLYFVKCDGKFGNKKFIMDRYNSEMNIFVLQENICIPVELSNLPCQVSVSPDGDFLAIICLNDVQNKDENNEQLFHSLHYYSLIIVDIKMSEIIARYYFEPLEFIDNFVSSFKLNWHKENQIVLQLITEGFTATFDSLTKELGVKPFHGIIYNANTSFDKQKIAHRILNGGIDIQEIENNTLIHLQGHSQIIQAVAFSYDNTLLASVSMDQTLKIWDVNTGNMIDQIDLKVSPVYSQIEWSPDGQKLALLNGNQIKIYKVKKQI